MAPFVRCLALASVVALTLPNVAVGHPRTHPGTDVASRNLIVENGRRLLKNCIKSEAGRELRERAIARRLALLEDIHTARRRLDATTALSTDHESSRAGRTANTSSSEHFTGEPACLLEPEVTECPILRICGVYSGLVARTNGNSDDLSNANTTFHRGLLPTDSDGFVSFTTKFPGLYAGRTTHIHIMTHSGGTVLANGTYSGGRVSHVGQLFFDQSLITEVQATGAYAENSNPVTTNDDDSIALQSAADDFDPFVQYAQLGSSIEDGLLSWISVGVAMTNGNSVSVAGTYTGSGGMTISGGGTTTNSGSASAVVSTGVSSASVDAGNDAAKMRQFGPILAVALMLLHLLVV
ncbi:hypothetical protein PHYPSEUDO_015459 [Phytophthora pseudosyringae]|uniref:Intradiol ring-cleavage dioxygenases domain-containing protein n=1 Tax=Phytophthora pseudosyringae TaxID=221518 RepID=A0A8T1V363_9STRA|nr:hypothetical protein PHYPSEUDO_015459 [Phytophthora pseudosyringae]